MKTLPSSLLSAKVKKMILILLLIAFLVLVDQVSKIIIAQNFEVDADAYMSTNESLHIHPHINDSTAQALRPRAEALAVSIQTMLAFRAISIFLLLALSGFVFVYLYRFLFWDIPYRAFPRLFVAWFILFIACGICSIVFDSLCWGGSLDFICITQREILASGKVLIRHKILDLKDIYLVIANICLIPCCGAALFAFCKNFSAMSQRIMHPRQNIQNMKKAKESRGDTTNGKQEN